MGTALATDGQSILLGASDSQPAGLASGAVHVYERDSGGSWKFKATILEPTPSGLHGFGISVAVQNGTAIVGANGAYGGFTPPGGGAAFVYKRTRAGSWTFQQKLTPNEDAVQFGRSVALDGDLAVIGSPAQAGPTLVGAAYVFHRNRAGVWKQVGKLLPEDAENYDFVGYSVALSGNLAVLGTNRLQQPKMPGKAWIYAVGPDEDGDGVMDACVCPGDIWPAGAGGGGGSGGDAKDWVVDQSDLGLLLSSYGACPGDSHYSPAAAALWPEPDPCVNQSDLAVLLAHYGTVCP
jgi:hypothetical protein